jgi:UDP-N-acetylmuramate--alanine ligase
MRWRDFNYLPPLPDAFFSSPRRVHFVGIGGIGMSALAFALRARGHAVSGSDVRDSDILARLRAAGISTAVGHRAENLAAHGARAEAVIFGSAVAPDNAERAAAATQGIVQWHRAQLLAYFVNSAETSIAVSGTHGKSTTSAMIAHILAQCGHNPTALLGAQYPPFGSNARLGDPNLVVVEADESDGSFTLLHPTIAVITNVEPEHLENYEDSEDELWRAFEMFAANVGSRPHRAGTAPAGIVLNADDVAMCRRLQSQATRRTTTYGTESDGDVRASHIGVHERKMRYDLQAANERIGTFHLGVPGRHNISNALGAICAAMSLDIDPARAAQSLQEFHGISRRFEFCGEANGILVYNDYGHHPTEVQSTLQMARDFLRRPIIAIFQPHRYSRTQQMGRDFGPAFAAADRVIITQLYSAFEEPIPGVSGQIVFDSVRRNLPHTEAHYAKTLEEARHLACDIARPGDALIVMGAGDIGALPPLLLRELQGKTDLSGAL